MWLKSKEFKKILGLSNQALYERRKRGSLKFKIINNVYFYWLEESIETDINRFNYFEYIFKMFGTEIEVVNLTKEEDFQTELTQDLISIIHHFSMKMYSNRRKELNALKKVLQQSEND